MGANTNPLEREEPQPLSATILTVQTGSGMLWSMTTLLQAGLQECMPDAPEERLLINLKSLR